jgi:HEAT repeat protein
MSRAFLIAGTVFFVFAGPAPSQKPEEIERQKANTPVNGRTLLEWENDLKDKDPSVREAAMATIKVYGTAARRSVPALIKELRDADVGLRVNAVITLGYIGPDSKDINDCVTALTALLRDQQGIVRFQAAKALGRIGREASGATPILIRLTKDLASWEIRGAAAFALGFVAYGANDRPIPEAVNALIEAFGDHSSQVRLEALYSLIVMGIPQNLAQKAHELTALQGLLAGRQPDKVQIWARVTIMRIENVSEKHLGIVAKYLKNPKVETRIHAARAFAAIGPDAKAHIDDLVDALADKDATMLYWTCMALGQMGDVAQRAIPALQKLLSHPDPDVRKAAQDAINAIQQKRKKQ